MNKLLMIVPCVALLSCVKEPTACILISPQENVQVFDEVTLTSCSEDAVFLQWEVEEIQFGASTLFYYGQESFVNTWEEPGTFDIYLTASSEEFKKEDFASEQITISDVCFECISDQYTDAEICYSDYEDFETFENSKSNFENSGYQCYEK